MLSMPRKFVTAFNGSRDHYEAPLALHEAGLLTRHVSDFYVPDVLTPLVRKFKPGLLARHRDGLPSGKVRVSVDAFSRSALTPKEKLLTQNGYFKIDQALSRTALHIAEQSDSDLLLHQFYAYWAFERAQGRRKILFQLHPHSRMTYEHLRDDYALYPEVAWSFTRETDATPPEKQPQALMNEWKLADAIICASSFTKASLVAEGANPDSITIVPYGAKAGKPLAPKTKSDVCRFIYLGQGVQRKGVHHLIRAWKRAGLKNSTLTMVCRLTDPAIPDMAKEAGINFLPGVSREELDAIYAGSDVFVMPSMGEGFGLVYLEALSMGLHVLGTKRSGLPDLNLSPKAVSYVEPGHIEEIAASLADLEKRWAAGDFDRDAIAAEGRRRTWEDHRRDFVAAATRK
jgi:glycosyltransferase involved in cell wall biosynthesis